ncbi:MULTISPECIES: sulfotransferase [unclassified Colwellia]|uniref:sulfotransferase n=1 Tax=unclassified Colwellia TaxID=196834 RepID=UPI0015F75A87|nr:MULTISPECIES: sulfotransferase [unclassified Colwellia]MBA6347730.1 sulfotransferase family protein [Colwellia sp. BRX8-9]MBA6353847.1 sulfotransferase family protein [Colwellia sp. BRX9-1]MBA6357882.1 sulfotransferase family protein [Colwellia sp. BRX8-3]MBA6360447.1 sulfotransferase family protein [Colwellia sp. BRX8-6]MBA6368762.1 sulfotransferase family protein [Colwellia sp. BRX8-5]|tara:strand:- start:7925 stop:8575 length:651 start_codon:yes stop_codon:yes gene_type:complete
MNSTKIFIIGLPRTGTTSICAAMLELGYTVAHTAYTQKTFDHAQVIADTPIFADFKRLDTFYPNSKFIYLSRESQKWLPSIKQLLQRMYINVTRDDGGFNTIIKRCYQSTFSPFTSDNIEDDNFLSLCYQRHKSEVGQYFIARPQDLLTIDVSESDSYQKLLNFLSLAQGNESASFERLNTGGKVTAWKDLINKNKIASTKNGRISLLTYLDVSGE